MDHETFFKKPAHRSQAYKDFVDTLPCCVCGRGPSTHHHVESGKPKGTDLSCIPLCGEHHVPGVHQMGKKTFAAKFGLDYEKIQKETLQAYVRKLEGK